MDENITIKDIDTSVTVGELNETEVMQKFMDWLTPRMGAVEIRVFKFPPMADIDYLVTKNKEVFCQVEIKVREKYWDNSIVPTRKEICAINDWLTKRIPTFYVAYYLDIKKVYIYNLTNPPIKRDRVTRKDRQVTSDYSYYNFMGAIEV